MSERTRELIIQPPTPSATTARNRVLTHIQGLRTVAVLLVVLYHLWPARLTGGYIGVDVFFVVSGYLMTSHILHGAESGRSIVAGLHDFYSRRIRRILPAALVVLAVTTVVTLAFVSRIKWVSYLHEVLASTLYVENWSLAASSTDYLAAGTGAGPVQHFWSLSVEEQFYLIWPLLLLALVGVARRRARPARSAEPGPADPRRLARAVLLLILTLIGLSLAYSVLETMQDSKFAYFDTFARLWEFGIGGLVAVSGRLLGRSHAGAAAASWLGLAAIAFSAFTFSGDTQFPGWVAVLPVLGAAAVLAAGERASPWGPQTILAWRPVQFLGDISYSLYLWHWPLIVLLPTVFGVRLGTPARIALLCGSVAVAFASKVLIEDPFRRRRSVLSPHPRRSRPWRLYAITLLAMVVVGSGSVVGLTSLNGQLDTARAQLAASRTSTPTCFGAEVLIPAAGCSASGPSLHGVVPDPLVATEDFPVQGCQQVASRSDVLSCTFGSTSASAARVALAGDSHATQWLPALLPIAQANNWTITTYVKSGCPLSTARTNDACGSWNSAVLPKIASGHFKYVFVSARGYSGVADDADGSDAKAYTVSGMTDAFRALGGGGATVVAFRDIPQPTNAGVPSVPSCVYGNPRPQTCDFDEVRSTRFDLIPEAAAADPGIKVVDMNRFFCTAGTCPPIIGDVLVYLDGGHMTSTYARSLTGALDPELTKIGVTTSG